MPTTLVQKKRYTYEDYLRTPDDQRYELIEGELIVTPSPIPYHQRISREIEFALHEFVTQNNLGEVFDAPCDVVLDEENVVQPDIFFISKGRLGIIGEKNIQGAPDLVIEIVSEGTAYRDLIQKKRLYERFGVKEFWLVVPKEGIIEVYTLGEGRYGLFKSFAGDDPLTSSLLPGLKLELKKIW